MRIVSFLILSLIAFSAWSAPIDSAIARCKTFRERTNSLIEKKDKRDFSLPEKNISEGLKLLSEVPSPPQSEIDHKVDAVLKGDAKTVGSYMAEALPCLMTQLDLGRGLIGAAAKKSASSADRDRIFTGMKSYWNRNRYPVLMATLLDLAQIDDGLKKKVWRFEDEKKKQFESLRQKARAAREEVRQKQLEKYSEEQLDDPKMQEEIFREMRPNLEKEISFARQFNTELSSLLPSLQIAKP